MQAGCWFEKILWLIKSTSFLPLTILITVILRYARILGRTMATSSAISNGGAWFNISVSKYFSPEFLIVPSRQRCPYFSFDNMSSSTTLKTGRTEFLYDQVKRIKNYIKFLRKIFLPYAKLLYYIKLLNFYFDFVLSSYIPYKKEDSSRRFVLSIKSLKSPLTWFTKSNNLKKKKKIKILENLSN